MIFLERVVWGNSVLDWMLALGATLGGTAVLLIVRRFALRRLRHATTLPPAIAEVTAATRVTALVVLALYVGSQFLTLPARLTRVMEALAIVALLVQVALWINRAIALWLRRYVQENREADAAGATTVSVLGFIGRLAVWAAVTLMILDNLGVNITTLVASLGIGGIAVALAVQNVLGDIFASLSIALDKPFVIGDFIVVGDVMGTVEYIGLKTTRLRSLSGEQIVFSNADLLKARVHNYKRMVERRVRFGFGVTYQTPAAQLERIPKMVREMIEAQPQARFDRAHFKEFGDSSLDFEVVYFVLDREFNTYMDIQQAINLALVRRFEAEGIEFAYPTRTLHVDRTVPALRAAVEETA
jgi:small-conductance mechanosensitive channel